LAIDIAAADTIIAAITPDYFRRFRRFTPPAIFFIFAIFFAMAFAIEFSPLYYFHFAISILIWPFSAFIAAAITPRLLYAFIFIISFSLPPLKLIRCFSF
jgi:hypothetical protein